MQLSEVRECAVIGVPDEKWGEAVKAMVVLHKGKSLTEAAIIAHCKQKLGGVKAPQSVAFIDAIPKTLAGKTDKRALREPYWMSRERSVH